MSMATHFFGEAKRALRTWLIVSPDAVTVWPNMTWPMSTETLGLRLTSSAMAAAPLEKPAFPSLP